MLFFPVIVFCIGEITFRIIFGSNFMFLLQTYYGVHMVNKGSDTFLISGGDSLFRVENTMKNLVLFVGSDEDSKKLLEDIKIWGAHDKIKIVDVSVNGLRGWLLVEYGSTKTPLLVTNNTILSGYEEIRNYIKASFSNQ